MRFGFELTTSEHLGMGEVMTLNELLSALATTTLSVTIKNATDDVITFTSGGWRGVEDDILARTVASWSVVNGRNVEIVMERQAGTLTLSANTASLSSVGDSATVTITAHTGEVSAVSSDETVATVTLNGDTITIEEVAAGTAMILVNSAATGDYEAATATVAVTCTE